MSTTTTLTSAPAADPAATIPSTALDELKRSVKDVLTPTSDGYNAAIRRFFTSSVRPAGVIVFPADGAEIKSALAWAQQYDVELVVKGGGHSVSASSSTDGGMVVDLEKSFRTVEVDPLTKTALVGGGAKWGDVDQAAIKHGLAVVGGTNDDTGVAGLTLGGGFGWRSSDLGMVCDNVLEFHVILADGSSVVASAQNEPDLFFALRGGGGNFGIVTHFRFQLHAQAAEVFFHQSVHAHGSLEQCMALVEKGTRETDGRSTIAMGFVPIGGPQSVVVVIGYANTSEEEGKRIFETVNELKPVMSANRMIPYEKLNTMMNEEHPAGLATYMTNRICLVFEPDFMRAASIKHEELTTRYTEINLQVLCMPLGKTAGNVPRDATAFPHRSPQLCMVAIVAVYSDLALTPIARDLAHQVRDSSTTEPDGGKMSSYVNADSSVRKLEDLYGDNWVRLVEIKKRVDPKGVFGRRMLAA